MPSTSSNKHCKTIGATNEGIDLLNACEIQDAETASPKDKEKIFNKLGVVTAYTDHMGDYCQEFIKAVAQHRHWQRQTRMDLVAA